MAPETFATTTAPPRNAILPIDCAVVVVSFNTRELLRACLWSVAEESPAETWVIDNGSTDGSSAMVAAEFPEARLIEPGRNLGFAAANNLALRQTQRRYVCLLNPDTVVHPGALRRLVAFMDDHHAVGVVGPQLRNADGSRQDSAFRFPGLWQTVFDLYPEASRPWLAPLNGRYPGERLSPYRIDHPLGACMVVRAAAMRQVGLLDERFFMYCEEIEWCWRIARAGWEVWSAPTAHVTHYGGQSTGQFRDAMFVELWKSRRLLSDRLHGPARRVVWRLLVRFAMRQRIAEVARLEASGELTPAERLARERAYRAVLAAVQ